MTPERRAEIHCDQCNKITDHILNFSVVPGKCDCQECLLCNSRVYVVHGVTKEATRFFPSASVAKKLEVVLQRLGIAADTDEARRISAAVQFAFEDWADDRDPKSHDGYMR